MSSIIENPIPIEGFETLSIEKIKKKQTPAQVEATQRNLEKGRLLRQQRAAQKKEADEALLQNLIYTEKAKSEKKLAAKAKAIALDLEYQEFLSQRKPGRVSDDSSDEEPIKQRKSKIEKPSKLHTNRPPSPPLVPPPTPATPFRLRRV